ncbi:DUF4365 domain-containing protein [Oerskovia turbata]|uniref:DUF4365 domain-containing protein n=1 Tax=Oerskovia turbata TaxID=1713 RepID=UPI0013E99793|nr:DUF4365 domain-containing protein [Oerskovia turbata]
MGIERTMPKRPSQHRLEEASRVQFAARAPASWAVSGPIEPDYGLDLTVEIFRGDEATGLRFGVQLKATEGPTSAVSVKVASLNYWLEQDIPVLVFRWSSELGRAWFRWAHLIQPPQQPAQETLRLAFSDADIWQEDTPAKIEREVQAARTIRRGAIRLPVRVTCTGSGSTIGVSAGSAVNEIRRAMRRYPSIVSTAISGPTEMVLRIRIERNELRVDVPGTSPRIIQYGKTERPRSSGDEYDRLRTLVNDALFATAAQLDSIGCTKEAAKILLSILDEPSVAYSDGLATAIAVLSRSGERKAMTRLLDRARVAGADHASLVASLVSTPVDEGDSIAVMLRSWVDSNVKAGDFESAAPLAYNLAGRAAQRQLCVAIQLMNQAADLDLSYRDRDYWNREIAGLFFLAAEFDAAANHYRRAIELGDESARVLLGDALMHVGRYAESLECLGAVGDSVNEAEFRLKSWCLELLVEESGITEQTRDCFRAERICDTDSLSIEGARQALVQDLLCPAALWRVGVQLLEEGDVEPGVRYLLGATFSDPGNARAWVELIGTVQAAGISEDVARDVLLCARQFAGDEVLDRAWQIDAEAGAQLQTIFEDLPAFEGKPIIMRATSYGVAEYELFER